MVGEMMNANDERDIYNREELLRVAAQILAGQCAYRADTQEKNIPAIITAAENLICAVNAHYERRATPSHSTSRRTLPSIRNSPNHKSKLPSPKPVPPSTTPSPKSDRMMKR